eukprot:TRINITY_DN2639_c0_g1_i1.p1 TRINITY_DN2639_c0_g1~~TRINITY_DN2639_c0_g1_i1.p1  ORF type:complete len:388 (+),score=44.09 TRINITY_DN2639_c0_g1_i1:126-1166(+)
MAASYQCVKEVCLNSSILNAPGTNHHCTEQLGSVWQSKILSRPHGVQGERVQCSDRNVAYVTPSQHRPRRPRLVQCSSIRKRSATKERRSRLGAPLEKNGRSSLEVRSTLEDDAVNATTATTTGSGTQYKGDGGKGRAVSGSDRESKTEENEVQISAADVDDSSLMLNQSSNRTIALISAGLSAGLFMATRLAGAGPDLSTLEKSSLPFEYAISNGRPTMVEFYADWCEVCRTMAKDVFAIEEKYKDEVNFVMLNIDNVKWAEEVDEFGVEGIPHFAFLDGNGDEEGVVVGKLPKNILEENVMALASGSSSIPHSQVIGPVSDISNKPPSARSTASVSPLSHGPPT